MTINVEQMFSLTEDELNRCVDVYVEAFQDEKIVQLQGTDRSVLTASFRPRIEQALNQGYLFITRSSDGDGDGDIACITCVFSPGQSAAIAGAAPPRAPESLTHSEIEWEEKVLKPHRIKGEESIPGGRDSTWYIKSIGTSPKYQGQGHASAMMKHVADLAKSNGGIVALSTMAQKAARVYRYQGFKDVYTAEITYLDGEKGPYHVMVLKP